MPFTGKGGPRHAREHTRDNRRCRTPGKEGTGKDCRARTSEREAGGPSVQGGAHWHQARNANQGHNQTGHRIRSIREHSRPHQGLHGVGRASEKRRGPKEGSRAQASPPPPVVAAPAAGQPHDGGPGTRVGIRSTVRRAFGHILQTCFADRLRRLEEGLPHARGDARSSRSRWTRTLGATSSPPPARAENPHPVSSSRA